MEQKYGEKWGGGGGGEGRSGQLKRALGERKWPGGGEEGLVGEREMDTKR